MNRRGFSLMELSVVLIIIALVTGGILVGIHMVNSAKIRAQITQIDKLNGGVHTFMEKYGGLPGDLEVAQATRMALPTGTTGLTGSSNGNGYLEKCAVVNSTGANNGYGCETALLWKQLSLASLVEGPFATSICAAQGTLTGNCGGVAAAAAIPNLLPQAKIGTDTYVLAAADTNANYFQIGGVTAITAVGVYTVTNTITPLEAKAMDEKWDDGKPQTGNVLAMGTTACGTDGPGCPETVAADQCAVSSGGINIYNTLTSTLAESSICMLRVNFY